MQVVIPKQCERKGAEFWHYGVNLINHNGTYASQFLNSTYNVIGKDKSGHWKTLGFNTYGNELYKTLGSPNSPNHSIKNGDGEVVWRATESASGKQDNTVKNKYNEYLESRGESKVSELPTGLYYFCWWPGINGVKVTVVGKNIYNNKNIKDAGFEDEGVTKNKYKKLTRIDMSDNEDCHMEDGTEDGKKHACKFIGWKTSSSAGVKNIIENTKKSGNNDYLDTESISGTSIVYYNTQGKEKRTYKKLYGYIGSKDKTYYAYYAPMYTLTGEKGDNTSIGDVKRGFATYAIAGENGTVWNNLNGESKTAIYKDDYLKICPKASSGYTLMMTINDGPLVANPETAYCGDTKATQYHVTGDTKIKTWAVLEPVEFNAQARAALGTNYAAAGTSDRISSGFVKSGSAGTLKVNCSSACQIGFWFDIAVATGSSGGTSYAIYRGTKGADGTISWNTSSSANGLSGVINSGTPLTLPRLLFETVNMNTTICYKMDYMRSSSGAQIGTVDSCVEVTMVPDEFRAQARIAEGNNYDGTTVRKSTGYVINGDTGDLDVKCYESNGCTVGVWFDLKKNSGGGGGLTSYSIYSGTKGADGTISWGASPAASSTSTPGNGTTVFTQSGNVSSGTTICYKMEYAYKPSAGTDGNGLVSTCAKVTYIPSIFSGKSVVTSGATDSLTVGWTDGLQNLSNTKWISGCSATDGCTVTFTHYMKRVSGIKSTTYKIERISNVSGHAALTPGSIVGYTTFSSDNETAVRSNASYTIRPGMVVCEKLTFKYDSAKTDESSTKVCASALGAADTTVDMNVKNNSVSKYNSFQKEVYAKPGDSLTYQADYQSILQYTTSLAPEKIKINNGNIYPSSGKNTDSLMMVMFNNNNNKDGNSSLGLKTWSNKFSVQRGVNGNNFGLVSNYVNYGNGATEKKTESNSYTIQPSDVGKSIDEKAITNLNDNTKTTPSKVEFSQTSDNYNLGTVNTTDVVQSTASAKVPYNFRNSTVITTDNENTVLYAGEIETISYEYVIGAKTNNETSPSVAYATRVDNPKWYLRISTNNGASWIESEHQNSNGESFYGSKSLSTRISIPDVNAGTVICMQSVIWPADSGVDTNISTSGYPDAWASSEEKCFTVAKKPSLQVWGGNVYSGGKIETSVSGKLNVGDSYNINKIGSNAERDYFGSWGELGVISNGGVSGFASGAATGYTSLGSLGLVANPGGSHEAGNKYCTVRSVLTFANENCSNNTNGGLNSNVNTSKVKNDKESVINKFISSGALNGNGEPIGSAGAEIDLNSLDNSKLLSNNAYYYYNGGDITVKGGNIPKSKTIVVHAKGNSANVTIAGNIMYNTDSNNKYATLGDIPKVIIYAENDIKIQCSVTRIDALLVAEGTVTTCSNGSTTTRIDNPTNSTQLRVNGAIIAKKLVANRIYGAATGNNSIVPAEIINYDPSLYLFGSNEMTADSRNDLDITSINEIAPRY
ncbi:hypothetical protein J6S37_02885 [Candidatus Saccharibacteria bacterium]|nr:hypothetical protein [Candidatus Saccharibacteria bacterium]